MNDQVSPNDLARFSAVEAALEARWPESKIEPSLTRIAELVDLLGDPQRTYPVIHIAGTNGKTSTSRMIDVLLTSFGLRVGRYTSPHLETLRERISLQGESISVERFLDTYDDIAPYLELVDSKNEVKLSYFEVLTAMAFAAFADAPVDVAVIECGLGGEWDATNVADGLVSVIMPIAIDHVEYLGDSIAGIAATKAKIIKEDSRAVLAMQPLEAAEELIRAVALANATPFREGLEFAVVKRDLAVGGQLVTIQGLAGEYSDIFLPLFGAHQAHNAAVAIAAVEAFLGGGTQMLDVDALRDGLAQVTSPGRLETLRRNPTIMIDAAHNPHGARALAEALDEGFEFDYLIGVIAVLGEKDAYGLLAALEPVLTEVVVTKNSSPRALATEELARIAIDVFGEDRVSIARDLADAIDIAVTRAEENGDVGGSGVVITGSVVTAGQARHMLSGSQ
ncbi:MAG TPA: folylpolyglutamate synthase/dihydrofolate synthase family protein [Candidatus Nanopelagicaceae bacterium]|nr:folylpolyglutamate synthase/dihydrofolate synthase family protein [Candidatus Nanopelagicaceae bacterium]